MNITIKLFVITVLLSTMSVWEQLKADESLVRSTSQSTSTSADKNNQLRKFDLLVGLCAGYQLKAAGVEIEFTISTSTSTSEDSSSQKNSTLTQNSTLMTEEVKTAIKQALQNCYQQLMSKYQKKQKQDSESTETQVDSANENLN